MGEAGVAVSIWWATSCSRSECPISLDASRRTNLRSFFSLGLLRRPAGTVDLDELHCRVSTWYQCGTQCGGTHASGASGPTPSTYWNGPSREDQMPPLERTREPHFSTSVGKCHTHSSRHTGCHSRNSLHAACCMMLEVRHLLKA